MHSIILKSYPKAAPVYEPFNTTSSLPVTTITYVQQFKYVTGLLKISLVIELNRNQVTGYKGSLQTLSYDSMKILFNMCIKT